MEKTLADFKQEVAEKYGCKEWGLLRYGTSAKRGEELCDEAAEAYADYRAQEEYKRGYEEASGEDKDIYIHAWNAALHWAMGQSGYPNHFVTADFKERISKGLKL